MPLSLPGIFLLGLVLCLFLLSKSRWIIALFILTVFGAFNYTWQIKHVGKNDLRNIVGEEPSQVIVTGKICGIPSEKVVQGKFGKSSVITKFVLNVESLQFRRSVTNVSVKGKAVTIIRGRLDSQIGDGSKITVYGIIKPPPSSRIYGLYDYREDLKNKGIFYMLIVDSPSDVEAVVASRSNSLKERFVEWTDKTLRYGLPAELSDTDLRTAMLFGFKTKISDEKQKNFMRSGTMHLFAVSGIHVGIISGAILVFLMSFNLSRQVCGIITLPMLWFFTAVTGWQASAIRAAVMVTILIGSWILNRPSNLLNSLYAAAIVILLWEPSQLFQTGFQLSFSVVLTLALAIPVFNKSMQEILKTDPLLPYQLIPRYKKLLINSARYFGSAFITSMAAFIGSMPLIAKYFNIISPISIFANLIVVPLGSLCLVSTMASMVSGIFYLPLAEIFNWAGWMLSRCMIELTDRFSNAGFGWFYVKTPTTEQILAYYLLFLLILLGFSAEQKRKNAMILIPICVLFLIASFAYKYDETKVDVISFERGHAVYAQAGFYENTLVDCGTEDDVRSLIEPLLISRGVNRISALFLTHGDVNHISGSIALSKKYFIQNVYVSNFKQRSRYYSEAIEYFDKQGNLRFVSSPQRVGRWEIISPDDNREYKKADDVALILRGSFGRSRILLLSDISQETLDYLVKTSANLKSDILIGSIFSIDRVIKSGGLDLIKPKMVIVTERGASGKAKDFFDRIKESVNSNIKVYYVESYTGLTLRIKNGDYSVESTENVRELLPEMNDL